MTIILKQARRLRKIKHDPLEGDEALAPQNRERDYLRKDELEKLFPRDMDEFLKIWPTVTWHRKEPPINYGVMLSIAVSGGLRSGELRALRLKHVSWHNGGVAVVVAKKHNNQEGRPKQNSTRAVLLPQRTMDLLKWWHSQSKQTEPDDYIFPQRTGRNLVHALHGAMDSAGIRVRLQKSLPGCACSSAHL